MTGRPGAASRPSRTAGAVTATVEAAVASPATVPPTMAATSPRLSGIIRPVEAARRCRGVSASPYAGDTPPRLHWTS